MFVTDGSGVRRAVAGNSCGALRTGPAEAGLLMVRGAILGPEVWGEPGCPPSGGQGVFSVRGYSGCRVLVEGAWCEGLRSLTVCVMGFSDRGPFKTGVGQAVLWFPLAVGQFNATVEVPLRGGRPAWVMDVPVGGFDYIFPFVPQVDGDVVELEIFCVPY